MSARTENRHEIVETLDRIYSAKHRKWFENVQIRICWTETQVSEDFKPKSDKHYVRAYADDGVTMIEHRFSPFKSRGAAKRFVPDFVGALKAFSARVEAQAPRRGPSADQPAPRHWTQ